MKSKIITGDCIEMMKEMEENSIDSVVTDPPYNLSTIKRFKAKDSGDKWNVKSGVFHRSSKGFMGKDWDNEIAFSPEVWQEVYRVLKPGAYLLSFGGTRTYHRMVCAIEDAGFEIRDMVEWLYGSGFPKSLNIGKKVKEYEGYGTALKPAHEPICMARKPLSEKSVAQNVLKHGTGGINIDGCRVEATKEDMGDWDRFKGHQQNIKGNNYNNPTNKKEPERIDNGINNQGRFPANLIHDGIKEDWARFFYTAKASKSERDMGCEGMGTENMNMYKGKDGKMGMGGASLKGEPKEPQPKNNNHPTVKPLALMKYLIKLVTPKGGTVLDPFAGSGSTLVAAKQESFKFIGIEKEEEYVKIAKARIKSVKKQQLKLL
jgi:site-specific DNA-methyltransferase (adenine-specific)